MSEVRLHTSSLDQFFSDARRSVEKIDRGDFTPEPSTVAFESMETLLRALTPNRWVLLRKLRGLGHTSIRALAGSLGRDYRGVHTDVVMLIALGLVERGDDGKISVPWSRITAEMSFGEAA